MSANAADKAMLRLTGKPTMDTRREGRKLGAQAREPEIWPFSLGRQHRTIRAMFKVPKGRHTAGYIKLDLESRDGK